jgi:hypothetical protein
MTHLDTDAQVTGRRLHRAGARRRVAVRRKCTTGGGSPGHTRPASNRSRSCWSVIVGASSASAHTCRSIQRSRPISPRLPHSASAFPSPPDRATA